MSNRTMSQMAHRGEITIINHLQAEVAVAFALASPEQCREVDADELTADYQLASGRSLTLAARVILTDQHLALGIDAGEVDPRDVPEIREIHQTIVRLLPVYASGLNAEEVA